MGTARKLSVETLKAWLEYAPDTGRFVWLASPRANVKEGDTAGHEGGGALDRHGPQIRLGGVLYPARHLAILYVTGKWPGGIVSPRNGIHQDIRFDNLIVQSRSASRLRAAKANANNLSGVLGVTFARGKWQARFRGVYLGVFDNPEDASAAYWNARNKAAACAS